MGRRFWYPDRLHVELVADRLAARLFPDYEPLSAAWFRRPSFRENPLLESALGVPRQPYYRTTTDKAGALFRSMVKNHPFVDGNKRIGTAVTFIFLLFNGYLFAPARDELVGFALDLAASEPDMSWQEVARWIRRHCVRIDRLESAHARRRLSPDMRAKIDRAAGWMDELEGVVAGLREAAEAAKRRRSS